MPAQDDAVVFNAFILDQGCWISRRRLQLSGVASIRPDEFRKIQLSPNWGGWNDAEELREKDEP